MFHLLDFPEGLCYPQDTGGMCTKCGHADMTAGSCDVVLGLFGPFNYRQGGKLYPLPLSGPSLELYGYLMRAPGKPAEREKLVDEIWHSADADKARGALNTAVWRLRKCLKVCSKLSLVTSTECLCIEVLDGMDSDASSLERALRACTTPAYAPLALDKRQALIVAAERCEGQFMSLVKGDWVLVERERQFNRVMQALTLLMHDAIERHDYECGLEFGRKIIAADPFREKVQCEVMWLYVMNGQRPQALKLFECLRAMLKRELGILPMPETMAVASFVAQSEVEEKHEKNFGALFSAMDRTRRDLMQAIVNMHQS
jgi:DNA-binding SARP family transcriptional activator